MSKLTGIIDLDKDLSSSIEGIKLIKSQNHSFQTVKKIMGTDNLRGILKRLYNKYTITQIEQIMNIPDSTLGHWFKSLDIPFKDHRINTRSIVFDENNKNRNDKRVIEIKITPELAYIIGFSLGDGTIQKYTVELFNKDLRIKKYLYQYLKGYGKIGERNRDYGLWTLRLYSVKISDLIKKDKKIRVDTLDFIFKDKKLAQMFVAAFWDAEGHISKRKKYYDIIILNTNDIIMNYIKEFLTNNKINFSLKYIKIGRLSKIRNRVVNGNKSGFKIRILKDSIEEWSKLVGMYMLHSKKSKIVKEILEGNKNE